MIEITIPGFGVGKLPSGKILIGRIVSDYTGTLSCGGNLTPGAAERLRRLGADVEIDVVSSDSFGTAHDELAVIPLEPHIRETGEHDEEKRLYVSSREPQRIAAFGNGRNDALMLKTVRDAGGLAIAVDNVKVALSRLSIVLTSLLPVSRTHWISCSTPPGARQHYGLDVGNILQETADGSCSSPNP